MVHPSGLWWAAMPKEYWEHPEGEQPDQQPNWHPRFGDRMQQLVFIGQDLNEAEICRRLDACLVEASVAKGNSEAWSTFKNPFPPLDLDAVAA